MKWMPFAMLALVACTTSGDTMEAYAPESVFHAEIENCTLGGPCAPLCVKLFGVDPFDLASCKILARDPGGARVRGTLIGDDGDVEITDDGSTDDSGDSTDDPPPDDGSCNDGSCDPPPDDPPPDDPPPDDGAALRTR
jgi:hypothetical protein